MHKKHNFFFIGFVVGILGTLISSLGLILRPIEIIGDVFLAPGRLVLAPWLDSFADINGFLNILIIAVVNGIIYGLIFWILGFVFSKKTTDQS